MTPVTRPCASCGAAMVVGEAGERRTRRRTFWRAYREMKPGRPKLYCGDACRQRAHRSRNNVPLKVRSQEGR